MSFAAALPSCVPDLLKENHLLLCLLFDKKTSKANDRQIRALIKASSAAFVECISVCCYNMLIGAVKVNSKQLEVLRRHKLLLSTLAEQKTVAKRRRLLLKTPVKTLQSAFAPIFHALRITCKIEGAKKQE